jgi:DNA-binding CsgD family transcriptional regulator
MDVSSHPTRLEAEPTDDLIIEILGANAFNNDLLAGYLEEQIGIRCFCAQDRTLRAISEQSPAKTRLIFFDCSDMLWSAIEPWITSIVQTDNARGLALCFNVDPNIEIEQNALRLGVCGVIYKGAPTEIYPRAINAILNGEMWYARKAVQRYLETPDPPLDETRAKTVFLLTRREQTILNMVARGSSNKEIADCLCISPHTVKTHIYNLFKKINVTNRFQATMWLSSNR